MQHLRSIPLYALEIWLPPSMNDWIKSTACLWQVFQRPATACCGSFRPLRDTCQQRGPTQPMLFQCTGTLKLAWKGPGTTSLWDRQSHASVEDFHLNQSLFLTDLRHGTEVQLRIYFSFRIQDAERKWFLLFASDPTFLVHNNIPTRIGEKE